ncbi:AraC family transcriptional regulator [Marinobacter nauticus]|uniref:AraC family transcriptional regulator n=1 Tax=Marinobacter nauticus TaxID=2743 RepID=UPI001C56FA2A|nr:AraC family transcriptional regulator [Marinobacter nauticus]MBW3196320.1 AraC family transcriptional regulator [Marinobacter nauticus]MBY6181730.1 AraC family transcriptional regulator [Marinobacter nauticus]
MPTLAQLLAPLAATEGYNPTPIEGVGVYRSNETTGREPLCYSQGIIIMAQGTKRVFLDNQVYEYNPDNYLVLTLPTPADCEAITPPDGPLLSLVMDLDLSALHELVRIFDECRQTGGANAPSLNAHTLYVAPATRAFNASVVRLAEALNDPLAAKAIGPGLKKELLLHALRGPNGASLVDLVRHNTQLSRLEPVLKHVHAHFSEPLDVEQLAALANMSPATFHRNFRQVAAQSPIQYIKRIRLTRARELLVDQGVKVSQAASLVGYESASQFSREFKRFYGQPPQAVTMALQTTA